jgi:hypothetical protein
MPAALSSLVLRHKISRGASTRFAFEVDIRHGKIVGVADDVGDAAILLDGQWWREAAAFSHGCMLPLVLANRNEYDNEQIAARLARPRIVVFASRGDLRSGAAPQHAVRGGEERTAAGGRFGVSDP